MQGDGDLLLFDCDGVLVDSEVLVIAIEVEMLAEVGVELDAAEVSRRFTGLSDAEMHRRIEEHWGVALPATFQEDKRARVGRALERDLVAVTGMADLLASLDGPRCVASSSAPDRIRRSLELTGLAAHFGDGHRFSASMVPRGKPAPDLFLHAAAAMGVEAARGTVVEDSPHGVEAGRAAGMRVVGFTAAGHCGPDLAERLRAAGAHDVATTTAELGALIAHPRGS